MRDPNHDVAMQLIDAIGGIRYGSVEITIHDGKIVQIERKEKMRFEVTPPPRRSY
jgi:hypothetical protein